MVPASNNPAQSTYAGTSSGSGAPTQSAMIVNLANAQALSPNIAELKGANLNGHSKQYSHVKKAGGYSTSVPSAGNSSIIGVVT